MAANGTFTGNFEVTAARAIFLQDEIKKDRHALREWVNMIPEFTKAADKQIELENMLTEPPPKYGRVILRSLQLLRSARPREAGYNDLIGILVGHQLNTLVENLRNVVVRERIFKAEQPEQDARFQVENFKIDKSKHRIREVIRTDQEALRNWSDVKNIMLLKLRSADVNLQIDHDLDAGPARAPQAILTTLDNWISVEADNAKFHQLLRILDGCDLNALTEKLVSAAVVRELRNLEGLLPDPLIENPPVQPALPGQGQAWGSQQDQAEEPQQDQAGGQQQEQAQGPRRLCPICRDRQYDQLAECGHFLCRPCVEEFQTRAGSATFRCPYGCKAALRASTFRRVYFPD